MYRVMWEMDIEADSAVEAARLAWEAMRAPASIANVFTVSTPSGIRYEVDLHRNIRTRHTQQTGHNNRQPYPHGEGSTAEPLSTFNDWTEEEQRIATMAVRLSRGQSPTP